MPNVVVVSKLGEVAHHNVKTPTFEQLYKRAGSKTGSNFTSLASWAVELETKKYNLIVFGKKQGKSNEINKYEFPSPIDNQIIYGNVVIVNLGAKVSANILDHLQVGVSIPVLDLTADEWNKIMDHLFGGFEDINSDNTEDDSEMVDVEEKDADLMGRTKDGYAKDGFVVDSEISEEEEDEVVEEVKDEPPLKKTMRKKPTAAATKKAKKAEQKQEIPDDIKMTNEEKMDVITNESIDMTDELEEEPYIV